jgi:hypothetical protein
MTNRRAVYLEGWYSKPICAGIWFYAEKEEDWDLARLAKVCRHEYGDGTVKFIATYDKYYNWSVEEDVDEMNGIWYGPLFVGQLGKPTKLLN